MEALSRSSSVLIMVAILAIGVCGRNVAASDTVGIDWPEEGGKASISANFGGSKIHIGISSRNAGAIDSFIWNNKQFVNSNDHGREFQSASFYDGKGVCFNPTEAGSAEDGTGPTSTSRILSLAVEPRRFSTATQMAYWLAPGKQAPECHGEVSTTSSKISDDIIFKTVTIGALGIDNAVEHRIVFRVSQRHQSAVFEALTGYMPPEFDRFWIFEPSTGALTPQSDGPGSQTAPLIFSTADGRFALGIFSPGTEDSNPVYGRWKFLKEEMSSPTVKWNCLFQKKLPIAGDYHFSCYTVVGSLEDVQRGIEGVYERFRTRAPEDAENANVRK